jgi:hypothetical protein
MTVSEWKEAVRQTELTDSAMAIELFFLYNEQEE